MPINPTAFAHVPAPDVTPRAGLAGIRGLQAGQQSALAQLAEGRTAELHPQKVQQGENILRQQETLIAEQERKAAKNRGADGIAKDAMNSWQAQDQAGLKKNIQKLAFIDPKAAEDLEKVLGSTDKNTFDLAARMVYGATVLDDPAAQNKVLEQAMAVLGPESVYQDGLQQIIDETDPDKKDLMLLESIELAKEMRAFPDDNLELRKIEATERNVELRELEMKDKEKDRAVRVREQDLRRAQQELERRKVSEGDKKILSETIDGVNKAQTKIEKIHTIRKKILEDPKRYGGGAFNSFHEWIKRKAGKGNEETALQMEVNRLRVDEGMDNLPPGTASDKDVEIALGPLPTASDQPEVIDAWFKGLQKMHIINAAYGTSKAKYMSEHGNLLGYMQFWNKNGKDFIETDLGRYGLKFVLPEGAEQGSAAGQGPSAVQPGVQQSPPGTVEGITYQQPGAAPQPAIQEWTIEQVE